MSHRSPSTVFSQSTEHARSRPASEPGHSTARASTDPPRTERRTLTHSRGAAVALKPRRRVADQAAVGRYGAQASIGSSPTSIRA